MSAPEDGEKKGNGRPAFLPSEAERTLARAMAADGADDQAIADAIEVSLPTLRKHLAAELLDGRAIKAPSLFGIDGAAQAEILTAPPLPPKRRGRPVYKPTQRDRDVVRMLAAAGISQDIIARRVGVSIPTLTRAYRDDLAAPRELARAQIIEQLHKQMMSGSTTAAEKLRGMIDEADLAAIEERRKAAPVPDKPMASEKETVAKKVMQARRAEQAGTEGKWAKLSSRSVQ